MLKRLSKLGIAMLFFGSIAFVFLYRKEFKYQHLSYNIKKLSEMNNIVPVAIIGGGPAGLSAAIFTSRAHFNTVIFAGDMLGGQLTQAAYVENWPGLPKMEGNDLINLVEKQAKLFGAQIVSHSVDKVDFGHWPFILTLDDGTQVNALTVIVATGGSQRKLQVPGLDEYWSKGIKVCTICDAPFDQDKDVAIIGAGDSAADKALQVSAFAKKVFILVRDSKMSAAAVVQSYLDSIKNIERRYNIQVTKFVGDGTNLTGIEMEDLQTKEKSTLPVQSVYMALGFDPNSNVFKNWLDITNQGYIKIQPGTQKTSQEGVFAAGNIEDSVYQKAGCAAGNGVRAGIDAIEFLQNIGLTSQIFQTLEGKLYHIESESDSSSEQKK